MHDVVNNCMIARFEEFHVKPDSGEIQEFNGRLLTNTNTNAAFLLRRLHL
jgi:hypothetical protein